MKSVETESMLIPVDTGQNNEFSFATIQDYLAVVRRRWLLILFMLILFVGSGVFYTWSQIKIYRATATIAIQSPQTKNIGEIKLDQAYTGAHLKTQLAVFKSRTLAQKVLQRMPEESALNLFGRSKDTISEDLLLSSLEVIQQKDTDIIELSFLGIHPQECAKMTEIYIKSFIEQNSQQVETSQTLIQSWLEKEMPVLEKKMYENRQAVTKLEEDSPDLIFNQNANSNLQNSMIERLRQELQEVKIQLIEAEIAYNKCKQAELSKNLEQILATGIFSESSLVYKLREQKFVTENRLEEYKLKYKLEHPIILSVKESLLNLDRKIQDEITIVMQRQQQNYQDILTRKNNLEKMLIEQQTKNIAAQQKYLAYERYRQEYEVLQKNYNTFLDKMKEIDSIANYRIDNIRLIDNAKVPQIPYKPNKLLNYLLSCLIGLLVGTGLAFFIEILEEKPKTIEEIQSLVATKILGTLPFIGQSEDPARVVEGKDHAYVAESLRLVTTSLFFSKKRDNKKVFVVTSPLAGDGKTTTICNLALMIAKVGYKVLLIDADLRRPKIHTVFPTQQQVGLTELLQGKAMVADTVQNIAENLGFISAGQIPEDAYECIYKSDFAGLLAQLEQQYDYVLIDSPPVGITSDTLILAKSAHLILVVNIAQANKKFIRRLVERLRLIEMPIYGVVVNDTSGIYVKQQRYNYYYSPKASQNHG